MLGTPLTPGDWSPNCAYYFALSATSAIRGSAGMSVTTLRGAMTCSAFYPGAACQLLSRSSALWPRARSFASVTHWLMTSVLTPVP